MLQAIRNLAQAFTSGRRTFSSVLVVLLATSLIVPLTASCQRTSSDHERGIGELRALLASTSGKPSAAELLRLEQHYAQTRTAALARFLRGYLHYTAQNYPAAIEALDSRAIALNSSLADYALFYRAESKFAANNKIEARRDFETLYNNYPDSLRARDARLRAAEALINLEDSQAAIKELAALAEANDADAVYLTAQAQERLGKNEEAAQLYRRIYYELPATAASVKAEERLAILQPAGQTSPASFDEQRARADALFDAKQYFEAAQAYDALFTAFPDAARLDEVQLRQGASLFLAKQPAQAVLPLAKVSSRNADLQAEALYYQAEALRQSNRAAESAVIVDRLLNQHAKNRRAQEALYSLATYLNRKERTAEAAARYRQLMALYPKTAFASEASFYLGFQAYRAKNYADAARTLEQHLATYRYPDTKYIGDAAFWAGKCEELTGNKARALALYDLTVERYAYGYHGYLARLRAANLRAANPSLKAEVAKSGSDLERMRQNALYVETVTETANAPQDQHLAKADDLEMIQLHDMVTKEFNQAAAGAPNSPKINLRIAQYYARRGDPFQATLIIRRGYPDIYSYKDEDLPRQAWEIFFPLLNWDTIKEEARRNGVDPFIAAGLIRQESVFNPNAISRVGARGLMQVMPDTGRLISRRQGAGEISPADLLNPQLNIKLGMNYLAQMLGQFGRIEYAAAAYNAGPGRAKQWIAQRGSLDIEDWIESIPFTETRGYVQGVLRYAANYRRFYKE